MLKKVSIGSVVYFPRLKNLLHPPTPWDWWFPPVPFPRRDSSRKTKLPESSTSASASLKSLESLDASGQKNGGVWRFDPEKVRGFFFNRGFFVKMEWIYEYIYMIYPLGHSNRLFQPPFFPTKDMIHEDKRHWKALVITLNIWSLSLYHIEMLLIFSAIFTSSPNKTL